MNRIAGILVFAASGAAVGWLARCELNRRRLTTPPRVRESLRHYVSGRLSAVSLAIPVDMELAPGDVLESLTVAVRGAGGAAEYLMRPGWAAPEIRQAASETHISTRDGAR